MPHGRTSWIVTATGAVLTCVLVVAAQNSPPKREKGNPADKPASAPGFTDTPMLPGMPWHVHDSRRPHPRTVTPAAQPGQPPSDAIVLFDGKDLSKWRAARLRTAGFSLSALPAPWKVENGYFEIVPGSGAIATREDFGDVQLHLEWMEPPDVKGAGQDRGNSGVFLMGLFEIQILDSYRNPTYADGQAGAIYGQWPPLVNAARKPGEWQSYDIVFRAPVLDGQRLPKPASITVLFNGVLVHEHKDALGPTVYRQAPKYVNVPAEGPLILQDHGNAVRFRNIWIRRLQGYDAAE
jgi:hypothetical protein